MVELLRRHAPEEGARDRRVSAEAAANEDVVRLPASSLVVADGRSLEAEVGNPVLRARMGASVEVQSEVGQLRAERCLEVLDQTAEPRLGFGDREVAVRLTSACDRAAADRVDVEREADRRQLGDDVVGLRSRDVRDDEVL